MPRANDRAFDRIDRAFGQRAAGVRAAVVEGVNRAVDVEQTDHPAFQIDDSPLTRGQFVQRARFDPRLASILRGHFLRKAVASGVELVQVGAILEKAPAQDGVRLSEATLAAGGLDAQPDFIVDALSSPRMTYDAKMLPIVESSHPGTTIGRFFSAAAIIQELAGSIS